MSVDVYDGGAMIHGSFRPTMHQTRPLATPPGSDEEQRWRDETDAGPVFSAVLFLYAYLLQSACPTLSARLPVPSFQPRRREPRAYFEALLRRPPRIFDGTEVRRACGTVVNREPGAGGGRRVE